MECFSALSYPLGSEQTFVIDEAFTGAYMPHTSRAVLRFLKSERIMKNLGKH